MMIAYVDIISGISGDMFLASLIDAGFSLNKLKKELDKLGLDFEIEIKKEEDVIEATNLFIYSEDRKRRDLKDIVKIIDDSSLNEDVKKKAKGLFMKLAKAEAKVHGISIDKVHFHEIGAVDTIVDIVGSLIALKGLGIEKLYSSPVLLGRGKIECRHGILPAPAPATRARGTRRRRRVCGPRPRLRTPQSRPPVPCRHGGRRSAPLAHTRRRRAHRQDRDDPPLLPCRCGRRDHENSSPSPGRLDYRRVRGPPYPEPGIIGPCHRMGDAQATRGMAPAFQSTCRKRESGVFSKQSPTACAGPFAMPFNEKHNTAVRWHGTGEVRGPTGQHRGLRCSFQGG